MNNAPRFLFSFIESNLASSHPQSTRKPAVEKPGGSTPRPTPPSSNNPSISRATLNPSETADAFVTSLFLAGTCRTLIEQHWLLTHGDQNEVSAYSEFLQVALNRELEPLQFLAPLWTDSSLNNLKAIALVTDRFSKQVVADLSIANLADYREFVTQAVQTMARLSTFDEQFIPKRLQADESLQRRIKTLGATKQWTESRPSPAEGFLPTSLYRAFDEMDQIFQLQYERDIGMKAEVSNKERLYEGAGVGVQTSYVTILTALKYLDLPQNGHVVDLGSGYGRVGLITGLWRRDLQFTGYEYVGHRVDISREAADRAGLTDRVQFFKQDLSDENFDLPIADAYYLYDPFCEATYKTVLERLHVIGQQKGVTVVTKSGANKWFLQSAAANGWSQPETMDEGTLLLFRSQAFT